MDAYAYYMCLVTEQRRRPMRCRAAPIALFRCRPSPPRLFAPQQFRPARAASCEARACTLRGVDQADLDTDQCQRLRDAAGRRLGWVRRLHRRMDQRGWAKSDPLYEQVKRTSDEVMRLDMLLMQIS